MAPRGSARLKHESEVSNGLITPDESMTSSGTVYPKYEELDSESFSDKLEEKFQGGLFQSYHGHSRELDSLEPEETERHRRSAAASVRSSYPPPPPPQPHLRLRNIRENIPSSPSTMSSTMASHPMEGGSSFNIVGRDVKMLVNTLDEMRRIGLKSIGTHLPELIMVGDQSAGKSSLMSAIAGVTLPTGQSMCTQCPTNIKTSHAEKWACKVFLQEEYTYVPLKKANQTFPNWMPRKEGLKTTPFMEIEDESELEDALKWAQIALLNPSQDSSLFVPGSDEHDELCRIRDRKPNLKEQTRFSPNVIAVEILAPDLPALSFFDLPGLFQTAEDPDQQYLVKVFEALTVKYVKHEKALIICAITMSNDPGLSRTKAVIADCEADHRCIGVLTMPDRLASTDYDNVLRQRTFVLPHGYFVTKQPAKGSTNLSGPEYHRFARREEERFFKEDEKWREGGEWAEFRSRCGTATLQKYISREFANMILNSLPDLERLIKAQASDVDHKLSFLPEVQSDRVQHIVRQRLFEFTNGVTNLLDGSPTCRSNAFHSDWKRLCYQFQRTTEHMRPGCKVNHPSDDERVVITIDDDSDDERLKKRPKAKRPRDEPQQNGPIKRPRLDTASPGPMKVEEASFASTPVRGTPVVQAFTPNIIKARNTGGERSAAFQKINPEDFGPFYHTYLDSGYRAMSLEDIQESIKDKGRVGIPEEVNPKVKEDYILTSIVPWELPLQDFLNSTFKMLREQIHGVLAEVLANYKDTALYRKSKPIVDEFLRIHEKKQTEKSFELYNVEKSTLFTINDHAFNLNRNDALAHLRSQRRHARVAKYLERMFRSSNGKVPWETFKVDQYDKVTDEKLGPDRFGRELEVAAYIRGYYNTARLRFTDSVCANMNTSLFHDIKNGSKYLLETKLGLDHGGGEEKCQELLTGNGDMAKRRNELKEQRQKLVEFKQALDRLRNPSEDEEDVPSSANDVPRDGDEKLAPPVSRPSSPGSGEDDPEDIVEVQPGEI